VSGIARRPGAARSSWRRRLAALEPLLWIGPAIALIGVVVLWPIVSMVQTSFQNITPLGITIGSAGLSNFSQVLRNPNLPGILVRTVIWVAATVAITMVISLGLAQLYNERFPGRRFARWAIIAPWAASVMMTALIFRWVLQPENGVVNVFLHQLGLVQRFNSNQGFSTWLFTIAKRTAYNHFRAARHFEELPPDGEVDRDDPSTLLQQKDERTSLWSLAEALQPEQREALWLRYAEGFSIAETAAILRTNQIRVRVLLHRARKNLATRLRAQEPKSQEHSTLRKSNDRLLVL